MGREKTLHVSGPLHDRGSSTAADDIDVVFFGLVFEHNPLRDVLRIAAEELDLYKRILFFKSIFERPHDLIDDETRVKRNFALLFGALDENFLPVCRVHEGDILYGCA